MIYDFYGYVPMESQLAAAKALVEEETKRYARQLTLSEIGQEGQIELKRAKVLIVGLGGLGNVAAAYLAAVGVGKLGLMDYDKIDLNNLHRQPLYTKADVGKPKVLVAKEKLLSINEHALIDTYEAKLTSENALGTLEKYDIILDCTDNFPARYLINDACALLKKPDIYGAAIEFEGQASVFSAEKGPCYRCFFPKPPNPGEVKSCADAGVLGTVPALIGVIQATEAIKIILGKGETLTGKLFLYNSLENKFELANIKKNSACELCGQNATIKSLIDYEEFCNPKKRSEKTNEGEIPEISAQELKEKLDKKEKLVILDVREDFERTICTLPNSVHIPVGQIMDRYAELNPDEEIIAHCHRGGRSAYATEFLMSKGFKNIKNLRGGIDAWASEVDPNMAKY